MATSAYRKAPKSLKFWKCASCDMLNKLFDTRCIACFRYQPFNDVTKLQLITLCKTYCDENALWNKLPNNAFKVSPLTKALTNKLYKIEIIDSYLNQLTNINKYRCGVLRIFNNRIHLTLDQLLNVYQCFASSNIGTPIFGTFDIGQIEQFINGRDLNDNELIENNKLSSKVANILCKIHQLKPNTFNQNKCEMIPYLQENIQIVSNIFDQQITNLSKIEKWHFVLKNTQNIDDEKLEKKLDGKVFGEILQNELNELIKTIEANKSFWNELVFSHNDYHSGNMILQQNEQQNIEEKKEDMNKEENIESDELNVKVIDYEYSGYNYRSFDFGNFFNELMIDNYYKQPPYFKMDETNYPSIPYRKQFVNEYLKGLSINDDTLDGITEIEYGSMLSHLCWAIWGIIESQRNDIDWNYIEFARQRLFHYFRVKQMIASTK